MKNKVQRKVYKINSKRFRLNKWNLTLTEENTLPEEVVKIGDNQLFDFIRQIKNESLTEQQSEISDLKIKIRSKVDIAKNLERLNELLFLKELCFVVIDKISDYHKLNKSMVLNGIEYKRLYATTGGVKTSTIIYVQSWIHDELQIRIDNGRNLDIEFSAGKLEAYKSLTFTNSVKVSNPRNIVVVKDYIQHFKESEIIELDDSVSKYPTLEVKNNEEIELNVSDGFGVISMEYADRLSKELMLDYVPSGFLMRNSFLKGMVFRFDIKKFAELIAESNVIMDIYGNSYDVEDVDMIIPESVFKLYNSYNSTESYIENCNKNGYSFRVAKTTPKKLDNVRNLNYQFIQTLELSDDEIAELARPTIESIKDIVNNDYIKTILFTKGIGLLESNFSNGTSDFTKALMVEPDMINDPFVKSKVHNMIKKKINDAKIGVLQVDGNFQTIGGDIFGFLEHSFGLVPTGLLKANEVYSTYWQEMCASEVAIFRAPMSSHNNIRKVSLCYRDDVNYWYGHLYGVMLLSSYDTITHALNGADKDGDSFFSTNSKVILDNIKSLPCVICKQKTAPKKICTFDDFVTANINGFGDEIGSITNKITEMVCKQSIFEKDSDEYKELEYRILCGQLYQQNAIDKIKSIQAKPMPTEWYSFRENIEERNEDGTISVLNDFNVSILADKKPYFFIYNYNTLKKEYNKYINSVNINSLNLFGMTLESLLSIEDKTDEIVEFLKLYEKRMPVDTSPSTMNRICWHVEKELNDVKLQSNAEFDFSILKTDKEYSTRNYEKVKTLYEDYKTKTSRYSARKKEGHIKEDDMLIDRDSFRLSFVSELNKLKIDEEDLANIVVDLCYNSNNSKQFAWDVVGDKILLNLLKKNDYHISYPTLDNNGDIKFNGHKFKISKVKVGDEFADNN